MFYFLRKLFGGSNADKISHYSNIVKSINAFAPKLSNLSNEELSQKTLYFKTLLAQGKTLDDILPEAFAVVKETAYRVVNMKPFDVQLIGGLILHQGKIAEMKTGEGKTLVATMPAYLNALTGRGVFIVTVNDYLARRDCEWMGKIFEFLGLSVGLIQSNIPPIERQAAYAAEITYGTNNEFGFDYLRDNMATDPRECVQRELHYAIVDEVDSILIDEARTPLIISGSLDDSTEKYQLCDDVTRRFHATIDFTIDEKTKNVVLTEEGISKAEQLLHLDSIYSIQNMEYAHMLVQSLRAHYLFKQSVDYLIKDGEVVIVDEFTGRLMIGRRYSDGLHQAIEAKERVNVQQESQTYATVTFQNYFRMFTKIAGMTGTALTEEAEFQKIYSLEVLEVPTNQPMIRKDLPDAIYKNKAAKYDAIIRDILDLNKKGTPVLVGTISIEVSEHLSSLLKRKGIPHTVLNAKYHEKEAEIISQAGQLGAVTIATNMAGRGTDIVLGEGVKAAGGLFVLGSERHESRRIDNQLRGRSGRQGDPGASKFYVALDDDLMRLFGGTERVAKMMNVMGLPEDVPIEHNLISKAIERAQKKVELYHYNIRKQLLEYDDVMNKQREVVYGIRTKILKLSQLTEHYQSIIKKQMTQLVQNYIPEKTQAKDISQNDLNTALQEIIPVQFNVSLSPLIQREDIVTLYVNHVLSAYQHLKNQVPAEFNKIEQIIYLQILDRQWIEHLHHMDLLKDGIGLRAYGQKDPLLEYRIEGFTMFKEMMDAVERETINNIFRVKIVDQPENIEYKSIFSAAKFLNDNNPKASTPRLNQKAEKTGRNDLCPCQSGKKYKKCCGA